MSKLPYTKQEIIYISSELVKALDAHGGVNAIEPDVIQRPLFWVEIPLEGRAKIVVHNPNQINKLYGQLNRVDFLGRKPDRLPTNETLCPESARGVPGKAVYINYSQSDFKAAWGFSR